VQRLDNDLRSLRESLQGVSGADVQRLNSELRSLQESLQGVTRADVQRLGTEFVSIRESLQRIAGENKGRVDELERRVSYAEDRLRPFQDEVQRLKDQTANATKDFTEAKSRYEQAVQVIEDFRVTVRNFDAIFMAKEAELRVLVKNLESSAGSLILEQLPIGSILMWPLAEKPPAKWRICDGAPVTAQEAPEFCELFKNAYWTTDGGKAVHVPDLRGYFIRGVDTRASEDPEKVDEEAPRAAGSKQREKFPQHSHDVSDLRVAGGLWWQQARNVLLYQSQRKEQLQGEEDLRALWGGGGEWNAYQLQRGETEVDAMALHGELGPMIKQQGEVRPDNIALHFVIRVQR
jgi:microcystin-dependent protein/archaellum component FlaC